jgi:predicted enzyme related to lactoylglutathione lyase
MSVAIAANPVNWFELPVVDMERAKRFYSTVLGSEFTDFNVPDGSLMAWFPMQKGVPGAAGALMKHPQYVPSSTGTLIYFSVPDVAATGAKVKQAGGELCIDAMSIGEYGYISVFIDTEGNRVGLHQAP